MDAEQTSRTKLRRYQFSIRSMLIGVLVVGLMLGLARDYGWKLWQFYMAIGGSLDPEPDSQSPFYAFLSPSSSPLDGRSGLRVVRRSGV